MTSATDSRAAAGSRPMRPTQLFPLVRHLSYWLTLVLLRTPATPNQITTASLMFGLGGAACFVAGVWGWSLTGALLMIAGYTLDNCDGEIARLKKLSSEWGAKFDDVVDWLVDSAFFIALGAGVARHADDSLWLWLGIAAAAGATIDYAIDLLLHAKAKRNPVAPSREQAAAAPRRPHTATDWLIYVFHKLSRADFCVIVLALVLFDIVWVLLPLAAIGAQAYWIADLFERARGWHT
jgi:phosphatidylglycerophosphate synthase